MVAALEQGTWGPALQDGDVPGLELSVGEQYGSVEDQCGVQTWTELAFDAESLAVLLPYEAGPLYLGGQSLTAYAIASSQWQGDVQCTDLAGELIWGLFR